MTGVNGGAGADERGADWLALAERAHQGAERAGATAAEALVTAEESALTRFANSEIHQNVAESNAHLNLRVVIGRREGVASSDRFDDEGLERLVESAVAIARLSAERDEDIALPEAGSVPEVTAGLSPATAGATPELRAEGAKAVIAAADEAGVRSFGAFSTGQEWIAVANSRGVRAAASRTSARLVTVSMTPDGGSGYAESAAVDVARIDPRAIGREASEKARATDTPISVEPGDYPVVLEEYAVIDILGMLGYLGFSALAVQEGRSFSEPGRRVGSDLVSIWDDGTDPAGLPIAIDYEGVGKQRVSLIEGGVCRDVVYDAQTAARAGRRSTGHGLPAPNTWGPFPLNMIMAPGNEPREELLGGLGRGLLVTRFWYTNPVHPKLAIITGMTRDGTFLVEDGKIVGPVRNLRFTQSYLQALAAVSGVSREQRTLQGDLGGAVVPAVRIDAFTFTGATEH